jgi:hypothetical protein
MVPTKYPCYQRRKKISFYPFRGTHTKSSTRVQHYSLILDWDIFKFYILQPLLLLSTVNILSTIPCPQRGLLILHTLIYTL